MNLVDNMDIPLQCVFGTLKKNVYDLQSKADYAAFVPSAVRLDTPFAEGNKWLALSPSIVSDKNMTNSVTVNLTWIAVQCSAGS